MELRNETIQRKKEHLNKITNYKTEGLQIKNKNKILIVTIIILCLNFIGCGESNISKAPDIEKELLNKPFFIIPNTAEQVYDPEIEDNRYLAVGEAGTLEHTLEEIAQYYISSLIAYKYLNDMHQKKFTARSGMSIYDMLYEIAEYSPIAKTQWEGLYSGNRIAGMEYSYSYEYKSKKRKDGIYEFQVTITPKIFGKVFREILIWTIEYNPETNLYHAPISNITAYGSDTLKPVYKKVKGQPNEEELMISSFAESLQQYRDEHNM